jgi:hypothetical protein
VKHAARIFFYSGLSPAQGNQLVNRPYASGSSDRHRIPGLLPARRSYLPRGTENRICNPFVGAGDRPLSRFYRSRGYGAVSRNDPPPIQPSYLPGALSDLGASRTAPRNRLAAISHELSWAAAHRPMYCRCASVAFLCSQIRRTILSCICSGVHVGRIGADRSDLDLRAIQPDVRSARGSTGLVPRMGGGSDAALSRRQHSRRIAAGSESLFSPRSCFPHCYFSSCTLTPFWNTSSPQKIKCAACCCSLTSGRSALPLDALFLCFSWCFSLPGATMSSPWLPLPRSSPSGCTYVYSSSLPPGLTAVLSYLMCVTMRRRSALDSPTSVDTDIVGTEVKTMDHDQ